MVDPIGLNNVTVHLKMIHFCFFFVCLIGLKNVTFVAFDGLVLKM